MAVLSIFRNRLARWWCIVPSRERVPLFNHRTGSTTSANCRNARHRSNRRIPLKAVQVRPDVFGLEVSADEFRLMVGALREICSAVAAFEFYARLGFTPEQAKAMARHFRQQADESGLEL